MSETIQAVIFDMDGLLVDSEIYWEEERRAYCAQHGCSWGEEDEHAVKGMNSTEWSAAIARRCGMTLPPAEIISDLIALMERRYARHLPLLPGATAAVQTCAAAYPLALASSSPLQLIESVLVDAGIRSCFRATVSADTIGKGKPAPDVFLAAARALEVQPRNIAVFEDSTAGIRAGLAAGMRVIAVPNPHYPVDSRVLNRAYAVLQSLAEFQVALLD